MVIVSAGEAEEEDRQHRKNLRQDTDMAAAAMVPERSRGSLPNFSSLPFFNVQWGRKKHLRCVKDPPELTRSESTSSDRKRRFTPDDGGIEALREKLMLDLRTEVHQMRAAFLKKSDVVSSPPSAAEPKPWNLRTRRAVCKEPNNNLSSGIGDMKRNPLPEKQSEVIKSPASRGSGDLNGGDGGEQQRAKFSGCLRKKEIEEDFLAMVGTRPARRPKKRPKYVQRQIDAVFPGFWLSEITHDMYKVNEQL